MLLGVIGLSIVAVVLAQIINLHMKHWTYSHLPGPPRSSFFYGNAAEFRKRIVEDGKFGTYWLDMVRQYGVLVRIWLATKPRVFVADPLVIKEMVTDFKTFPRPGDQRSFIDRQFSFTIARMGTTRFCGYNSILTDLGGPIWKRKKKIMDPAFSIQKLTKHLPKFYDIASCLCKAVEAKQLSNPGTPIDVGGVIQPFTIDAISSAGFSASQQQIADLRHFDKGKEAMPKIIAKGGNRLALMMDSEARKGIFSFQDNIKTVRALGAKMIMDRTSNGEFGKANDVLDSIISANIDEKNGNLEIEESLDDFMTMYVAGNATTYTALMWSLGELTRNPDVMDKLVAEVDAVWSGTHEIGRNSSPGEISETIKEMTYLEAFVKEVLRYDPPVQFIPRVNSKSVKLCGYDIPPNTLLTSSQYVLHRWEKFWDNPDVFRPERFITSTPKPYTYVPFFLGPRQCIGKNFAILELKCMLCELLTRFEIEKDPVAPMKLRSKQGLLCFPTDNSYTFKPRN